MAHVFIVWEQEALYEDACILKVCSSQLIADRVISKQPSKPENEWGLVDEWPKCWVEVVEVISEFT